MLSSLCVGADLSIAAAAATAATACLLSSFLGFSRRAVGRLMLSTSDHAPKTDAAMWCLGGDMQTDRHVFLPKAVYDPNQPFQGGNLAEAGERSHFPATFAERRHWRCWCKVERQIVDVSLWLDGSGLGSKLFSSSELAHHRTPVKLRKGAMFAEPNQVESSHGTRNSRTSP